MHTTESIYIHDFGSSKVVINNLYGISLHSKRQFNFVRVTFVKISSFHYCVHSVALCPMGCVPEKHYEMVNHYSNRISWGGLTYSFTVMRYLSADNSKYLISYDNVTTVLVTH